MLNFLNRKKIMRYRWIWRVVYWYFKLLLIRIENGDSFNIFQNEWIINFVSETWKKCFLQKRVSIKINLALKFGHILLSGYTNNSCKKMISYPYKLVFKRWFWWTKLKKFKASKKMRKMQQKDVLEWKFRWKASSVRTQNDEAH